MNPTDESEIGRMLAAANGAEPIRQNAAWRKARRAARLADAGRVTYLHLCVGPGSATLALMRDPTRSGRVYVGIAMCSPLDQWDRKRGCRISSGRLARVMELAAARVNPSGLGFVFATTEVHRLDKEAFEAFEAWLFGAKHAYPLWLRAWADEWPGKPIPVALRRSMLDGDRDPGQAKGGG